MAIEGNQAKPTTPAGITPEQAAASFLQAAVARVPETGAGDPSVSVAFALGWQMAEVLLPDRRDYDRGSNDLPGISSLTTAETETMGLLQMQAGLTRLHSAFAAAGLQPPDAQAFAGQLPGLTDATARMRAVRDFHVKLLTRLTAADFRLGKAYGLGRALADTTRGRPDLARELRTERVATLTQWTRELASALPAHAGHPVADSLDAWAQWAAGSESPDPTTVAKLAAQGKLWRGLLSGEKHATDMLETRDYLQAGEGLLQRSASLAWTFLRHYWRQALLVVALFAVGVALVVTSGNAAAVGAGAASILASFGLSWKGAASSLGTVAGKLEQPLWGAELDAVVYQRITPEVIVASQRTRPREREEASLVAAGRRFEARQQRAASNGPGLPADARRTPATPAPSEPPATEVIPPPEEPPSADQAG